jgi:adenylosuccinate synthase
VTPECREAEMQADSAQTRIASTRKGIGEAISRKVLRSAKLAGQYSWPQKFTDKWPNWQSVFKVIDLNISLQEGKSRILCEIPQGLSLSLNSAFYPHVTSRDCTVMQAMSDAGVHPSFIGSTMLVMRTFPIRVGNIVEETKEYGIIKPWSFW